MLTQTELLLKIQLLPDYNPFQSVTYIPEADASGIFFPEDLQQTCDQEIRL